MECYEGMFSVYTILWLVFIKISAFRGNYFCYKIQYWFTVGVMMDFLIYVFSELWWNTHFRTCQIFTKDFSVQSFWNVISSLSFIIVQLMKQGNGKLQREVNISKEEVLCGLWAIRNSCSSISSNMVFREFQKMCSSGFSF